MTFTPSLHKGMVWQKVKQDLMDKEVYVKRKGQDWKFWDEAVNTALFFENRAPTSCLKTNS